MKINKTLKHPRWYDIHCCCGITTEDKHPIKECLHCKFEACEKSLPKKDFQVCYPVFDEKGNDTGKKETKTISEVTIVRGDKYQDIIGWSF